MAAMLDFAILPAIAKKYAELPKEELITRCKKMAQQLGMPEYEWPRIHLPAFISIDGATIHPLGRQLMAAPRASLARQQEVRREALLDKLQLQLDDLPSRIEPDIMPAAVPAATNLTGMTQADRAAQAAQDAQQQRLRALLQLKLRAYRRTHKEDPWLRALWEMARFDPRYMCVPPEQWMPLSLVSPDLHSPVEHMVGTLKYMIRILMIEGDLHRPELRKGKAYQEMIDQAVAERGNGAEGRHHIAGSVRKLPHICHILAAEQGVDVEIEYAFGGGQAQLYKVPGTAGRWIRDTKWT